MNRGASLSGSGSLSSPQKRVPVRPLVKYQTAAARHDNQEPPVIANPSSRRSWGAGCWSCGAGQSRRSGKNQSGIARMCPPSGLSLRATFKRLCSSILGGSIIEPASRDASR